MDFEKPVCVSVFVNNAMACWDLAEVWERSNPPGAGKHSLPQHTHTHTDSVVDVVRTGQRSREFRNCGRNGDDRNLDM